MKGCLRGATPRPGSNHRAEQKLTLALALARTMSARTMSARTMSARALLANSIRGPTPRALRDERQGIGRLRILGRRGGAER